MLDEGGRRKREVLLLTLCSVFVGFFVTAEILGGKLFGFVLPGISPASLGLSDSGEFVATAGILAFPLTFLLTDVVNEYFGKRIVRVFTFLALGVNLLLQPVIQAAIRVRTVSFTPGVESGEMHRVFQLAFGQTWSIVVGSLVAFLIAQLIDAQVFTALRRRTGGKLIWLRSQGSTVVSQLIDTFVVIFLAFWVIPELVGDPHMTAGQAFSISVTNYVYKFLIAVALTPLLYAVHALVKGWLGHAVAEELVHAAHPADPE